MPGIDYTDSAEIQKVGLEALRNALRPVGMAVFLRQNMHGDGISDYTAERNLHLKDEELTNEGIINSGEFQNKAHVADNSQCILN
ncbi:MAG: hypothetical protein LBR82_08545 [Desulfovibrio sp.]|nr:hypothetical protein [Desulfovibrio sp.]